MEKAYRETAEHLGLSCEACLDNCCRSYFQHHTYIEWAYLWRGLEACDPARRDDFLKRAEEYVQASRAALAAGQRPRLMCPLNENGWCGLYPYRMMICRLHGVPNRVHMPDGNTREFPGCSTCQELVSRTEHCVALDRTPFYIELAELEREFLGGSKRRFPRVNLTLAEMIDQGPPDLGRG